MTDVNEPVNIGWDLSFNPDLLLFNEDILGPSEATPDFAFPDLIPMHLGDIQEVAVAV